MADERSDKAEEVKTLTTALRNLLKQVDDFCAMEGEADFYTGEAVAALAGTPLPECGTSDALKIALRARCPGNGDGPDPVECQSYEASEQGQPCPPGCCVMAETKDVRSVLAAIEDEEGPVSTSGVCPYCASNNDAIRGTFYDQNCPSCVARMGAK